MTNTDLYYFPVCHTSSCQLLVNSTVRYMLFFIVFSVGESLLQIVYYMDKSEN